MFIYSKKTSHANIQIEIERELGSQEAKNLKTVLDNVANGNLPFYGINEMNLTRSMVNAAVGTSDVYYTNDGIKYTDCKKTCRLHFYDVNLKISAVSIIRDYLNCGLLEAKNIVEGKKDFISDDETVRKIFNKLDSCNISGYEMTSIE